MYVCIVRSFECNYMGTKEKLIKRFLSHPKDFTFEELVRLLNIFGYEMSNKGKTSGSRVSFFKENCPNPITFHKPHPTNVIKEYVVLNVIETLRENEDI